jgi:NAD(P)H-hydrate epimerase
MRAYNSAQSKALDKAAQASGVAGFELMRRAGLAAFQQIGQHFEGAQSLLVLAGKGNNGGDAWIVAGAAHAAGFKVHLWPVEQAAGGLSELNLRW